MTTLFIAYDTVTGRILGVHRGPSSPDYMWTPDICRVLNATVIKGAFPECKHGKRYKVEVASKHLVETTGEDGVSFGSGKIR